MHLLTIVLLTVWASCAQGQGGTCDFPKIKHGSIYNENRYEHVFPVAVGKYVYYSCEQSFASPKQSVWTRIECTAEGWSPDPQCLRHCILPSVEHGHSDYSQVIHLEGETVKITCDIGYSLPNNQRRITCTESGWSTEPICIPYQFCYRPTFENARTQSRRKRFKVNDHLEYDCHPGYENKHGNTSGTIECGDSGWSDTPTCFDPKEKCGRPPAIDNGDITSMPLKEYAPGSLVKYQCQSYYKQRGNSTIICNKGKWTIPPECLDPCVISEDIMDKHNIQIQVRRGKEIYFQWGETVQFMCKRGYQKQTEQKSFRATCMNGNLTYPKCE